MQQIDVQGGNYREVTETPISVWHGHGGESPARWPARWRKPGGSIPSDETMIQSVAMIMLEMVSQVGLAGGSDSPHATCAGCGQQRLQPMRRSGVRILGGLLQTDVEGKLALVGLRRTSRDEITLTPPPPQRGGSHA